MTMHNDFHSTVLIERINLPAAKATAEQNKINWMANVLLPITNLLLMFGSV